MSDVDDRVEPDPLDQAYPPLDAVNSRWWYWIGAYLVTSVLFVPVVILAVLTFVTPVVVGRGDPGGASIRVFFLLFLLLIFGFVVLAFAVFVMLPVGLYMDARQVARAGLEWEPDPVIYGVLGLLQFFVTPIIGFFVALYYLYQRHKHVGVP